MSDPELSRRDKSTKPVGRVGKLVPPNWTSWKTRPTGGHANS